MLFSLQINICPKVFNIQIFLDNRKDLRNVVLRRREPVVSTVLQTDLLQINSETQDDDLIAEIRNEYETIPPEYLQSSNTQKVSFNSVRQMSLGEFMFIK